jgi:beta-galactosidase GanA
MWTSMWAAVLAAANLVSAPAQALQPAATSTIPRLERRGTAVQLLVDGAPFLALAGELGNSSGEADFLRPYWPKLQALHLNTVLVPVYWDQVEPEEGRFDFSNLDALVGDAGGRRMRLVLLWFGSWKNSMSCYAPAWVKTDVRRFPRARDASGRRLEILSPFSEAGRDADARAFAALMRHLREIDGERHTVIMVQVENEVGMIPEARDRSPEADALFAGPLPARLLDYLRRNEPRLAPALRAAWATAGRPSSGSWEAVFGKGPATDELFTAWHLAAYVDAVASAGKKVYPLPMFANAALVRPNYQPGQYPSGGPLPHLVDVWRAAAPSIDFLSPDIYFANFAEWCRRYAWEGNAFFVPEAQRGGDAPVNAFYVVSQHNAIGFAPFAIESIGEPGESALAASYQLLSGLAPLVLAHQGRGAMAGLLPDIGPAVTPQEVRLGEHIIRVTYERQRAPSIADGAAAGPGAAPAAPPLPAGGLVAATGRDEFVFAGTGVTATFAVAGSDDTAGIQSAEEGRYEDGKWVHLRWLNGDQTHQGRHVRLEPGTFSVQRVKLYRYPAKTPAGTSARDGGGSPRPAR